MIKLQNSNYNKSQHEIKYPLTYTDVECRGLWLAIKLPRENKILSLCLVDRNDNECKGNSVAYHEIEEFEKRYYNREFLDKDVLIQY